MVVDFFVSWALWEKMTFVLVCLIVLTFCAGFTRLWWMNKMAKKYERLDEEKRARTEELRNSGLIDESNLEQNVPFGVRAIESGIEIDGIWVSRPNTPVSETITLLRGSDRSADSSAISSATDPSQQSIPLSVKPQPLFIQQRSPSEGEARMEVRASLDVAAESRHRPMYKPRRSSQLRFSSSGEVESDEESPGKMEKTLHARQTSEDEKDQSRRLLAPSSIIGSNSGNLPIGDSDQLSGSSSNSMKTFSSKRKQVKDGSGRYQPISTRSTEDTTSYEEIDISTFSPSSKTEHLDPFYTVPVDGDESPRKSNSFASRILSSVQNSSFITHGDNTSSAESQMPLLAQKESPASMKPTFGPGDLHMNTAARKVNSGFEVLPAGTFGPHPDLMTNDMGNAEASKSSERKSTLISGDHLSTSTGKRSPRKLQKRERKSFWRS